MRKERKRIVAGFLMLVMVLSLIMPGMIVSATTKTQQKTVARCKRVSEITFGEQYLLIGGSSKKPSQIVTGNTHAGPKVSSVFDGVTAENINFSDSENQIETESAYLWTIQEGEDGTCALYNVSMGKYLHFTEGERNVSLKDEAAYFKLEKGAHLQGGTAFAFHINDYYLNYSDSQNGFCAYDASEYEQDITNVGNQYALYHLEEEEELPPEEIEGDVLSTLLFCSDFQTGTEVNPYTSVNDVPESLTSIIGGISKNIYEAGYEKLDNVLVAGDYSAFIGRYNYDADPTYGIEALKNTLRNQWSDLENFLFVQGNHDSPDYAYNEGANEYDHYIVYCINTSYHSSTNGSYPWMQGSTGGEAKVKLAAEKLQTYLDGLIEAGENRPVIVLAHLPIHFTGRTSSLYGNGDNMYASCLFDVINSAAESLNMAYVYGHNHSKGWDSYMGGSSVFKKAGDTILIPDASRKTGNVTNYYTKEKLNFCYMNAGYIGYNHDTTSDSALTATVCQIYKDKMVFKRFDQNGVHNLGSVGSYNNRYDDSALIPREEVVSKSTRSPFIWQIETSMEPGVKIVNAEGNVGETVELKASARNIKDAEYRWESADPLAAEVLTQGKTATLFCKKSGEVSVKVTAFNKDGVTASATCVLKIEAVSDETGTASVNIIDTDGKEITTVAKGDTISLHASVKNIPEIIKYEWSVSDEKIVRLNDETSFAPTLKLKKEGAVTLKLLLTYKDDQGVERILETEKEISIEKFSRYERVNQVESGEQYLLIGTAGALTNIEYNSSGIACLQGEKLEEADLGNESDVVKGKFDVFLWTVTKNEDDTYSVYNEAADKYLSISDNSRNVGLSNEPVNLGMDTGSSNVGAGECIALHNGSTYLNYSKSKGGYCGYAGAGVTDSNNQYILYKFVEAIEYNVEELEKAIEEAEALDLSQYQEDENLKVFKEALAAAKLQLEDQESQEAIDAACKALRDACSNLKLIEKDDGSTPDEDDKQEEKPDEKPSEKPDEKPNEKPDNLPKTGDTSQIWFLMMIAAASGIVASRSYKKQR